MIVGGIAITAGGVAGGLLGGATTATGAGAAVGVPAMVVSTTLVVGGAGNIAAGIRGLTQAMMSKGSGSSGPRATTTAGSQDTNITTTRTSGGTTYRFNTGHSFNRAHKGPGGIKDFSNTGLTADQIETAIMGKIGAFRAGGGTLPISGTPGFSGPYQGNVTFGSQGIGFRAVQSSSGEIIVSTYFPM
jgi:hypothetical protein